MASCIRLAFPAPTQNALPPGLWARQLVPAFHDPILHPLVGA
jgi:hypothetical protein